MSTEVFFLTCVFRKTSFMLGHELKKPTNPKISQCSPALDELKDNKDKF